MDPIEAVLDGAGVEAWLHAVDLDTAREVSFRADEQVVIASLFKLLIVLAFAREVVDGRLDPTERVVTSAGDRLGGWGLAGCADDVELSLRDLAFFAMTVSDNTAADLLLHWVGIDTVSVLAEGLGLSATRILGGPREVLTTILDDVGAADGSELAAIYPTLSAEQIRNLRVFDPSATTSSTPRDITTLLKAIWCDAVGAEACGFVRALMAQQVVSTRLASGFPPGTQVAAKSATLPGLTVEAGVVEPPDGGRYAIAAFVRMDRAPVRHLEADRLIGRVADAAVAALREHRPTVAHQAR